MTKIQGKVAVVTGAGSGIGRELALQLAAKGARVAVSDVDLAGLEQTRALLATQAGLAAGETDDTAVHVQRLDVAEREAVLEYAETVKNHFGAVHIIVNNAGIAFNGPVEQTEFKDVERIMDVDFWGVVNGTKAFLPHLIESGDGHVVNVSSLFGLLSMPGQAAYNAAKFAVRGFTEALQQEMIADRRPVRVTCVHPGGVKTAIARNATAAEGMSAKDAAAFFDKHLARTTAEQAAATIIRGVERDRSRVLIGADAKLLDALVRLFPALYRQVNARIAGRFTKF